MTRWGVGVESKYMIHTVVYLYIFQFQYGPNTSFITILYILRPLIQFCIEKSYLKKIYGGRAPGAPPSKSALARPQHQASSSNHHCAKIPKTSIWKKTPKPFVRGIHQRLMDSISQWASNAESISMSWRHMMCRLAVMSTATGRPSTQLDWQGSSSDPVKVLEFETVYCSIGKVRKFCVYSWDCLGPCFTPCSLYAAIFVGGHFSTGPLNMQISDDTGPLNVHIKIA